MVNVGYIYVMVLWGTAKFSLKKIIVIYSVSSFHDERVMNGNNRESLTDDFIGRNEWGVSFEIESPDFCGQ